MFNFIKIIDYNDFRINNTSGIYSHRLSNRFLKKRPIMLKINRIYFNEFQIMTECPTCKLSMESHSTSELMECCMKQVGDEMSVEKTGVCLNCKHELKKHSDGELAECTIAFLKSGMK